MASKGAFRALGNNCWTIIFLCFRGLAVCQISLPNCLGFNIRIADDKPSDHSSRMLSRPLGLAQDGSQEVLGTGRASHPDDHWSPIRVGSQLECQEGATLPLCHNQFRHNRNPFPISGQPEGESVNEFISSDHSGPKVSKERCLALSEFCRR